MRPLTDAIDLEDSPVTALTPEQQNAAALLMESVAIPEFARKLAADYGVDANGLNQADLRTFSDHLQASVDTYLQKRASDRTQSGLSAAKVAIDVAFQIAGANLPSAKVPVDTQKAAAPYLELAGVKEAADLFIAARVESAKAAVEVPTTPGTETDEDKKNKLPAPAAA